VEKLLEMKGISKSFYGVKVLHEVDFDVGAGEVVALCGENGAGKSTLMKILAAVQPREGGTITVAGKDIPPVTPRQMQREGVSMIHQELELIEDMTVAQNIFLTREPVNKLGLINFTKMNRAAKELLDQLGQTDIDPSAKVFTLRVAQKQMVEIAKAMSFELKVIVMDEPTAVLTSTETEILFKLIENLSSRGIGVVYISHRLAEIKQIADRVTILRDGHFIATKNVDEVTENEIACMMVGRDIEHTCADDFEGDPEDVVLEVKGVTGDILKDVSFKLAKGEILGFSGLVGAGRSELMEMVFGLRKFSTGQVLVHGSPVTMSGAKRAINAGLGFATEDRKKTGLVLGRSIAENADLAFRIKKKGNSVLMPRDVRSRADKMIENLRIKCNGAAQLTRNLSGGNQQKVVLAKWLSAEPDIFIVDEPTRGIDVGARAEIYSIIQRLAKEGKAIIIVSSDITEILCICQRIVVMYEGTVTGVLTGNDRNEDEIMRCAFNVARTEE